jgi:hypothetical protein
MKIKDTITLIFTNIAEAEQLESKIKFMKNYVSVSCTHKAIDSKISEEDEKMIMTESSIMNIS